MLATGLYVVHTLIGIGLITRGVRGLIALGKHEEAIEEIRTLMK